MTGGVNGCPSVRFTILTWYLAGPPPWADAPHIVADTSTIATRGSSARFLRMRHHPFIWSAQQPRDEDTSAALTDLMRNHCGAMNSRDGSGSRARKGTATSRVHHGGVREHPILVVDDEPMVREVLSRYLAMTASRWRPPPTARRRSTGSHEFGARPRPPRPDAARARRLRGLPPDARPGRGTPVIMLTARGEETDRIVGLELGADDYVDEALLASRGRRPGPGRAPPDRAPIDRPHRSWTFGEDRGSTRDGDEVLVGDGDRSG